MQFHWQNRAPVPYADFDDFIRSLQREKRKKIVQERRRVSEAGVSYERLEGGAHRRAAWDFFYRCYTLTYRAHHSTPYLTRSLLHRDGAHHGCALADVRRARVAASALPRRLIALDPSRRVAYGRYWGAVEHVPCLHFDACYYQPLAWCIAHGYERFEGGAQGEHKMARGLLPVKTVSAHWLADPRFASAVSDFLHAKARVSAPMSMSSTNATRSRPRRSDPHSSPWPSHAAMPLAISCRAASGPSQPTTLTHLLGSRSL